MPEPLRVPAGARLHLPYRQNLILHHKYNLLGGVLCPDLSDSNPKNDGTLTNFSVPSTAISGWAGQGLSFDGVNDYVRVADNASLDITSAITISTWVYNTRAYGGASYDQIFGKGMDSSYSAFWIRATGIINFRLWLGGVVRAISATQPIGVNVWKHLVFTYNGATMKIYVNGLLDNTGNYSGLIGTNDLYFGISGDPERPYYMNGLIDDVRIYNRALSAGEVMHSFAQQEDEWDLGLDDDFGIQQGIPIELMRGGVA